MLFAEYVQKLFNALGFQLSRRTRGVQTDSALEEQLRLVGKNVKTIFEIGAADGRDSAVYSARCPEAKVYAFEPLPTNFEKLQSKANLEPRIIPINKAISDASGTASFHITALADASSLLQPNETGSTFDKYTTEVDCITVETLTLDEFCKEKDIVNIDILKIDAQGAEIKILKGCKNLLSIGNISIIYCEVNFMEIYDGCSKYHEVATYLADFGYKTHNLYDIIVNQDGKISWCDAIFTK
jgi:FkbM family methyltransferase